METEVNWDVDQENIQNQIRTMIRKAHESGKSLVLPINPDLGAMLLIVGLTNCDGCDARCCKDNTDVALAPSEYRLITEKYGPEGMYEGGIGGYIKMPCRFLKDNRCTIYADRPIACIAYPCQEGGAYDWGTGGGAIEALSVASPCPAMQRLTRQVFMVYWRLQKKVELIGYEEARKILATEGK